MFYFFVSYCLIILTNSNIFIFVSYCLIILTNSNIFIFLFLMSNIILTFYHFYYPSVRFLLLLLLWH
jgi:hypothetical protein